MKPAFKIAHLENSLCCMADAMVKVKAIIELQGCTGIPPMRKNCNDYDGNCKKCAVDIIDESLKILIELTRSKR